MTPASGTTRTLHVVQLMVAAALFSTAGAGFKACTLDSWQIAFFRAAIAAVTVFALVPDARRGWTRRTAAVAVAYAITGVLFVHANKLTTAASTTFLQAASPLYIALLSPWLLGERIRRRDVYFMAALAAGLALLLVQADAPTITAPSPREGNLLAVLCGLFSALMLLGLRGLGRDGGSLRGSAPAAVVLGNLFVLLLTAPWVWPLPPARAQDWLILVYLGVLQLGLAYTLLVAAMRKVPALQAALLMFVEPVLSPLWAWLLHGERPGFWTVAGGALILLATAVYTWRETANRAVDSVLPSIPTA